jgi:hypothetical protein
VSTQDTHSHLHLAPDAEKRAREIDESFTPWQSDPQRIARLLLWLDLLGESPRSVRAIAEFIRDPTPWRQQYAEMEIFEHPKPGEVS